MAKTGLLVIDMQVGLFAGEPCHDAEGVVSRINALARAVRDKGDTVILIQHENEKTYAPGSRLWQFLPGLDRRPGDVTVGKRASDCFYRSDLVSRPVSGCTDKSECIMLWHATTSGDSDVEF